MGAKLIAVLAAGALIASLVAIGGVAFAQPDGVELTACVKNNNGQMRLVSSGDDCLNSEYPVSWNQAGQPGAQGSPVFETGKDVTRFEPGDPALDFMRLDLPAGNYVFYVTTSAIPEALFDPDGNPAGFAQGGAIDCRFFEERTDGTRVDLTGVKHGTFGAAAVGSWSLDKSTPGAFVPFISVGDTYTHSHPDHPDDTAVVAVCQHSFGELIDVHAGWTAVTVGEVEFQPSL